jgi:hypothetical protein
MVNAMGVAGLMSFGLIKASFMPKQEMQERRSLLRTRTQLTRQQTRHVQRFGRSWKANAKRHSVITDITGRGGQTDDRGDDQRRQKSVELVEVTDYHIKADVQGIVRRVAWTVD